MDNQASVYISVCSRRNPEWEMYTSLQRAIYFAQRYGINTQLVPRVGGTLICRERQRAFGDFLKSESTHLLTLDDDIVLPEDAIVRLVGANKDIIGGVYRLKDMSAARVAIRIPKTRMWPFILKANIVSEADYLSSGCMLISRAAAVKMVSAYDEDLWYSENVSMERLCALYQPYIHTHKSDMREYLSEDWAFCQRARNIGLGLHVHGGVKCGHWGLYNFDFYFPEKFVMDLGKWDDVREGEGKYKLTDADHETMEETTI